ncbi:hypothetical protein ACET3Z_019066 [Daucus carota]
MLWNPLTGEGKVIEYPRRRLMSRADVAIGFGYDGSYNLEADGSWSKGFTVGPFHFFFSQKVYAAVSNGGMILCSNLYNGIEFLDVVNNVLVPVSEPETFAADWLQAIPYRETLVGFGPGTLVLSEENLVRMAGSSKSLVEDIYNDLVSRRNALIKALTKDLDQFHSCLDAGPCYNHWFY